MFVKTVILIAALIVNTPPAFSQSGQTLTGTVTDTMCGVKHTMSDGGGDDKCVRDCVKGGSDYGLIVGDKVYTLKGDTKAMDKLAGQKVTVKGTLATDTITVTSIALAKG